MSYILEALRKMERQKRRDAQGESLIDGLSVDKEDSREAGSRPGRLLVFVSILFGVAGILAGLMFYQGDGASEGPDPAVTGAGSAAKVTGPASGGTGLGTDKAPGPSRQGINAAEVGSRPPKGVTLSQIKSRIETREKTEAEGPPAQGVAKVTPKASSLPKGRVIDLTDRYKLTSTGKVNNTRFATINRHDYRIGDEFKGLEITDIEKDRVHLRAREGGQRYVIIFRYRK